MSTPVEAAGSADGRHRPDHAERRPSAEARDWLRCLRGHGPERVEGVGHVRVLLLHAARFEVGRRRLNLPQLEPEALEAIACESAEAALTVVLARLDEVGSERCFSTWVYKFAVLEAAARVRKLAWQTREEIYEQDERAAPRGLEFRLSDVEERELISFLKSAIVEVLSPNERQVLVAFALNNVPIDVLAERLDSTRAGVYGTLRQARAKVRAWITARCDLEPPHSEPVEASTSASTRLVLCAPVGAEDMFEATTGREDGLPAP